MRRITAGWAIGLMIATVLAAACDDVVDGDAVRGSGDLITETRDVSGFDEIALLGSGDVFVDVIGTETLTIEAEDNLMPLLTSDVRGGRLELGSEGSISPTEGITYVITADQLVGVTIAGSGTINADGIVHDSFDVIISGSGNVITSGTTDELDITIGGSGDYEGEDLIAARAAVSIGGSGSVLVNATDELDVSIGGSGDVVYIGDPVVTERIGGSGEVSRR